MITANQNNYTGNGWKQYLRDQARVAHLV